MCGLPGSPLGILGSAISLGSPPISFFAPRIRRDTRIFWPAFEGENGIVSPCADSQGPGLASPQRVNSVRLIERGLDRIFLQFGWCFF